MVLAVVCTACMRSASQDIPQRETQLRAAEVTAPADRAGQRHASPVMRADTADLRRRAVASTADALRHFAGVNLRDYGGSGGLKTVSVRGLGAQHTLVCYDGLVVADSRSGTTDLSRFPIESLSALQLNVSDQPELLCPARQLGAATLQLRPVRPDTARRGMQGGVALRQGSFGLWHPSLRLGHSLGRGHTLGASAQWLRAENDYPFHISNGLASHDEHRQNSRVSDWDVETSYEGSGAGWGSISANARFGSSHRRLPGPVVLYVSGNDERLDERTASVQVRYDRRRGQWQLMAAAKGSWNESLYCNRDEGFPGGVQRQNYWQREAYVTLGAGWSSGALALAYAADGAVQSLNSNLPSDNHASRASLLQSLSLRLTARRLVLTARALLQLHSNHLRGNEGSAPNVGRLTPSLSVGWLLIDAEKVRTRARVYYNNVYRLPTFTENYFYHYGNPHLRPEHAQQLGIGMETELTPSDVFRLSVSADVYANRVRDKITSLPVSTWLWQTQNMGRVRARGADVTAEGRWSIAKSHALGFHMSYSWQQVRDRTDKALRSYGMQLAYTPEHSGSAAVSWESPWLSLSAALIGSSSRWSTHTHTPTTRLPGYAELDLSAWRSFALGNRCRLMLRADLVNALDNRYEIVRRYPMPGRNYRIGAELDF